MHLMSHGMTMLMHMGNDLCNNGMVHMWMLMMKRIQYDVHVYEHMMHMNLWCICIVRNAHDVCLMLCTHDDAYVDECAMYMLMRHGDHDAVSA
jgi:hypothetical protein